MLPKKKKGLEYCYSTEKEQIKSLDMVVWNDKRKQEKNEDVGIPCIYGKNGSIYKKDFAIE